MLIRLNNGIELNPIATIGEKRYVQGANRDTLVFVFPVETSLDELDKLFTSENCAKITIYDNDNEYIHNGYTIKAELKRETVETNVETDSTPATYESRVMIAMSQVTYAEQQLIELAEKNTMLEECVVELAQVVYA